MTTSAPQESIPPRHETGDCVRIAIGEILHQERPRAVLSGALVTILSAGLLITAAAFRDLPGAVTLVFTIVIVGMCGLTLGLQFAPVRHLYTLVVCWLTLIGGVIVGQLTNFYFGLERNLVLEGVSPVLMVVIPVTIVAARALLRARDAFWFNWVFISALALICLVHTALYWQVAEVHYAMVLMLVTVLLAAPLTDLLMDQHFKVQFAALQAMERRIASISAEAAAARQERNIDALTGSFNRSGIIFSLENSLQHQSQTAVARLSLSNTHSLRQNLGEAGLDQALVAMAQALKGLIGAHCLVGRNDGGDFTIWGPTDADETTWIKECQQLKAAVQAKLREAEITATLTLGAGCFLQGTDTATALEEVSFRSFMDSMHD